MESTSSFVALDAETKSRMRDETRKNIEQQGGVVTVEEQGGRLVITPAAVMEVEMYGDDQIKAWDKADELKVSEKDALLKRPQA